MSAAVNRFLWIEVINDYFSFEESGFARVPGNLPDFTI